ncbi:MAG: hypothetical protein J1E59_05625 [Treponema sp.]|nr:hypothetical protein [Treponema sp.]
MKRKLNSSLGLVLALFCLCAVSCANIFQDKVAMSRSGSSTNLGNLFVGGAEVGKLGTPLEINVSVYEFKDKIRISWSPVQNAEYYVLERAVVKEKTNGEWKRPDESDYEPLEHTGYWYSTSYTDIIITDDKDNELNCDNENYGYAFFYRVIAGNSRLGYDEGEPVYSSAGMLLLPPSGTKASAGDYQEYIEVKWNKSSGASRYEIYRSEREDGSNSTRVGMVTASETVYNDYNAASYSGQDFFYTVRSVGFNGEVSVSSPVGLGYTSVPGAPKVVDVVEVVKGEGHGDKAKTIKIRWEAVADANIYTVYRTSSKNSSMKTMTKVTSGSLEYLDSNSLEEDVYYYYYVQPSKEETTEDGGTAILKGPMSKTGPDDTKPVEGFILSKPSVVEVTKKRGNQSENEIYFAPVIGDENFPNKPAKTSYSNKYTYVVYGDGFIGGSFTEVAGSFPSPNFDSTKGKYHMAVKAFDYYKVQVEYNGEKSAMTDVFAPAPYEATEVYVTCAERVEDIGLYNADGAGKESGANANGVHKVKITWKTPDEGAYAYDIYRSEKETSGFRKITENPILDDGKETHSYLDKNESAKVGQIYYYKVLSLNSLKQGANYSVIYTPTLQGGVIKTFDINIDGKNTRCGRGWGWGALSAWQYIHEMCKTVDRSHAKSKKLTTSSLTGKIGTEIINGDVNGYLDYNAKMDGIGGRAILLYKDYVDYYIGGDKNLGYYFMLNGNTNSSANASQNGTMDGIVTCNGMYQGRVDYGKIEVKGGDSGGGYYILTRTGIDESAKNVSYMAGKK